MGELLKQTAGTLGGLLRLLIPELRAELLRLGDLDDLQEIRLRLGQPVRLRRARREQDLPLLWQEEQQQNQLMLFTENSLYAFEEQVRQGFITLPGGHRAGLCGTAWYDEGRLAGFRDIASINLRIAREIPGVARPLLPYIISGGRVRRTLLAAPPGVGKTTLLRDLARLLAEGEAGIAAQNVGIADERQELAAVYAGRPALDLGSRCDVISGCAKALAVAMLLRTMSPDVIITDEIGSAADAAALQEALNAGVSVLASAHAAAYDELLARPSLKELLLGGYFERVILPERRGGRLAVRAVYDESGVRLL